MSDGAFVALCLVGLLLYFGWMFWGYYARGYNAALRRRRKKASCHGRRRRSDTSRFTGIGQIDICYVRAARQRGREMRSTAAGGQAA
jgi:hypothetical protein